MTVCYECAKLGSGYWEPKFLSRAKKDIKRQPLSSFLKRKQRSLVTENLELVGDFSQRVRQAREAMELGQEDLGRKIKEKVSVIRKIETGKMVPDLVLAEKLEHALKITLRIPASEPNVQPVLSSKPHGTTLGDLIQFKVKEKGGQE
jgi:putative transcription factor